jgi:hypothetical protein
MEGVTELADKFTSVIINPLLALLFVIGFLVFIFGVLEFLLALGGESESRQNGKKHMLWGVVGMFIMSSAYAIVKIIQNTFPQPPNPLN